MRQRERARDRALAVTLRSSPLATRKVAPIVAVHLEVKHLGLGLRCGRDQVSAEQGDYLAADVGQLLTFTK